MFDSINAFRIYMMKKLRALVRFKKMWTKNLRKFVFRKLLKNDNFICLNYEKVSYFYMNDNHDNVNAIRLQLFS